ncbi:MAG: HAD-IIIC family phosphatase [bacterium]|nr:HAD-IIIC family phosphatase [bacterium]
MNQRNLQVDKEIKCVVWDLDNTLWEGTLLEPGEVVLKPQVVEILEILDSRGILHSIASKNNHDDAMNKLKEFGVDHYFLYPEINWNAKSTSIENIQKNLNFGMDTILFIDDQEFERDEVNSVHSTVVCVDAEEYRSLPDFSFLNPRFVTQDSAKRREMYLADIKRNDKEKEYKGAGDKFLRLLDLEFTIAEAREEDLQRAAELTVRTNQLNATGKTFDYDELNEFRKSDSHILLSCELKDKYGSYGKIGLALVEITEHAWYLKLLLMSCRVMSRGVGTILLTYIMKEAKKNNKKILADFKQTDRNRMMYISYKFANFKEVFSEDDGTILFENDLSVIRDYPPHIKLILK